MRRETERPDISSAYTARVRGRLLADRTRVRPRLQVTTRLLLCISCRVQVREVDVGVSDPSLKHTLGYTCAWRDVIPAPHPTDSFRTANSPE